LNWRERKELNPL